MLFYLNNKSINKLQTFEYNKIRLYRIKMSLLKYFNDFMIVFIIVPYLTIFTKFNVL